MNTSKWTRVFIVKSATRIERQGKSKPREEEGATEEVRGTSYRPRPRPILHTGQGGKAGAQSRKPRQETLSKSQQQPRPPTHDPTDWPIFLDGITHVLVGNCSFSKLVVAKRAVGVGCLPRQTNKQTDIINNSLHAPQVLKYSTNASPKFHGERRASFYNNNIPLLFFFLLFFFFAFQISWCSPHLVIINIFLFNFCDVQK